MKTAKFTRQKIDISLVLLLVTAFFAPQFGGYVSTDATSLPRGLGAAFRDAWGGSGAPVLGHALLSFPILAALFLVLVARRVQQVPKQIFTVTWIIFFLFVGVASVFSSYRALSLQLWLEWICYGCAMFGAVSISGRRQGISMLSGAIAAGCFVVAVKAILEYGQLRSTDPSWRVFAGWVNPNATAAMLLLGTFLAIGICLSQNRMASLFSGLAAGLMIVAMVLTGSKGAVSLALPIGLLALGVCQQRVRPMILPTISLAAVLALAIGVLFLKNVGWIGLSISLVFTLIVIGVINREKLGAIRLIAPFAIATGFLILLNLTTPVPRGSPSETTAKTPMTRVSEGSHTQEQSSEFRLNLWRSAGFLIKQRPIQGYGLGSYRAESARSGLTTATIFAHNVYLQLWAETGIVPFLLFIFGLATWLKHVGRSRINLPTYQLSMLSGVVAAVVSVLTHSLVDSDLYYFGIGICFFLVLGLGLSLASDAVAPELIQKPIRALAGFTCIGISVLLSMFSILDVQKSVIRGDLANKEGMAIKEDAQALDWANSFDGEAVYVQALSERDDKVAQSLKDAYAMFPSQKIGRMLANVLSSSSQFTAATETLQDALTRDPNNLRTLSLLMKIQLENGKTTEAVETAKRLVAVEATPYFKVRSIPESIPTETFDARLNVLAPNTADRAQRARLLTEAVRGYLPYSKVTFGIIKHNAATTHDDPLPGYDTVAEGSKKIQTAIAGAMEAADIYRLLGNASEVSEMEEDAETLRKALAD